MKIIFHASAFSDGIEAEWPAAPREGEFVHISYRGGGNAFRVDSVSWEMDENGEFRNVSVHLSE